VSELIQSLLVANRGEIACRIIRTARAMGIRTVAVYSDADAKALHVRRADEAVHIGASPARESYLVGEKIIAAAKQTGAEAIHPGYGFLSENAKFAQSVIDAGLIWVGPSPASIAAMGLKDAAKKLMAEAGVPVTPGYLGEDQDPDHLAREAANVGYPVLIKAVAGGGGKGMRLVEKAADFADAFASCQREALASFGNAHVLIEKYIQRPRHIEVQVFGDSHGNIVHLFERDCSLQRRHQKVIEEAPAPGMDEATREVLCAAAVRAARAVNYVGAGTVEFIADASEGLRADRIWFMEMNTRLQVEHPVTEEITGVDLVEWQLRVASGEALPKRQEELSINGWAMEARLYAEDPAKGFLPSVGRFEHLGMDNGAVHRIDNGVMPGDEISQHYDPMIAKLIARSSNRAGAISCLKGMCGTIEAWPIKTNAGFLTRLLQRREFKKGEIDTGFIADKVDLLTKPSRPAFLAEGVAEIVKWHSSDVDPKLRGFRLNRPRNEIAHFVLNGEGVDLPLGHALEYDSQFPFFMFDVERGVVIFDQGEAHLLEYGRRGNTISTSSGTILSPMPGKIVAVEVRKGDVVTKGQKLLTLEAMKMEHSLVAPFDGTVAELNAAEGAQVQVEALLARIEAADE
jgi:3-methylcrotonyl-CoA carboxylase alpha subunit